MLNITSYNQRGNPTRRTLTIQKIHSGQLVDEKWRFEMERIKVTLTISKDDVHISRSGRAGTSFDTGEDGKELNLAIDDLATELKQMAKELS